MPPIRDRIFVAFETPREVLSGIAAVRDDLRSADAEVRWETDDKLHCTIKFLGETDRGLLDDIIAALEGLTASPFAVVYRSVGCFPDRRDPKVVWMGIDNEDGKLTDLYRRTDDAMTGFGFKSERRPYRPHLTLGRVKGRKNIGNLLERMERITFQSQPVTIQGFEIVKSVLKPEGSTYSVLRLIPLKS